MAALYGLRWRETYLALIPTMSETALPGHALGKLMNWFQVKEMHALGCRRFDFTIGNEPYKRDYGAGPSNLYHVAQPLGFRGIPTAWLLRAETRVRRWRRAVKEAALARR